METDETDRETHLRDLHAAEKVRCKLASRPTICLCSPNCRGWDVFDTGRGMEIQACDECNTAPMPESCRVTDAEVRRLPEAQAELQLAKAAQGYPVADSAGVPFVVIRASWSEMDAAERRRFIDAYNIEKRTDDQVALIERVTAHEEDDVAKEIIRVKGTCYDRSEIHRVAIVVLEGAGGIEERLVLYKAEPHEDGTDPVTWPMIAPEWIGCVYMHQALGDAPFKGVPRDELNLAAVIGEIYTEQGAVPTDESVDLIARYAADDCIKESNTLRVVFPSLPKRGRS
jgi:hypothetical protein